MFVDALTRVSNGQQVTADAVSTNDIDMGNVTPKRNVPVGEPMAYCVAITAVGTNTGSAKIQAIQSATAGLGSGTVILGEVDLVTANLVAGQIILVPCGFGPAPLRYHGLNFDITGTVDFTVTAWFGPWAMMAAQASAYAKGYTITG